MGKPSHVRQHFLLRTRLLAGRTEVCATLRDDNTLDDSTTAHTRGAILLVDKYMVVIVASLTPEIAIVIERGTTVLNTICEDGDNAFVQGAYLFGSQ